MTQLVYSSPGSSPVDSSPSSSPTEVWARNPVLCIREVAECNLPRVIIDEGLVRKKRIDPVKWISLHYPASTPWRVIVCGDSGVFEYRNDSSDFKNSRQVFAIHPLWSYVESDGSYDLLLDIINNCDWDNPEDKRIILNDLPMVRQNLGKQVIYDLHEIQEAHPEVTLHVHGLYSWRYAFGLSFKSVDIDFRTNAANKSVNLPNGKRILDLGRLPEHSQWIHLMGFTLDEMKDARSRCLYGIKSALWAGQHFKKEYLFRAPRRQPRKLQVDTTSSDKSFNPQNRTRLPFSKTRQSPGNLFLCNSCGLQDKCSYFRLGAVCIVPGSEPTELARFFKSRDSRVIIDGLNTLLALQANRIQQGVADETFTGKLDPEVTKMVNGLFDRGVKLAKLVDPALNSPKLAVMINGSTMPGVAMGTDPRDAVAGVVAALEARGVPREDITPEMITNILSQSQGVQRAIEGVAIAVSDDNDK